MSEQLQIKDNFMSIFSEMNEQIKDLQEDNKIFKSKMFDGKTSPDVKAKLNHYSELYKDNIFMKKIINKKEKLIKKLKQQQKNKRHVNTLFFINQLVEKIDLMRNL